MLSTLMFAFMLHLYCDEPKAQTTKTTTQTSGCNEPTMKNYSNCRAALRPAKNTVPKVPRSARAALK